MLKVWVAEESKNRTIYIIFSKLTFILMHVKSWIPIHHWGWEAGEFSTGECLALRLQWEIDSRDFPFCKTPPQKSPFPLPLPTVGLELTSKCVNTIGTSPKFFKNTLKETHLWITSSLVRGVIIFSLYVQKRSFRNFLRILMSFYLSRKRHYRRNQIT